jgi:hypothetical protein
MPPDRERIYLPENFVFSKRRGILEDNNQGFILPRARKRTDIEALRALLRHIRIPDNKTPPPGVSG